MALYKFHRETDTAQSIECPSIVIMLTVFSLNFKGYSSPVVIWKCLVHIAFYYTRLSRSKFPNHKNFEEMLAISTARSLEFTNTAP